MNKFFLLLKGIFVLFVCIPFFAHAGNEKYVSTKSGNQVFPEVLLNVQDKNFPNVLQGAQYVNSRGIITLSFDQYNKTLPLVVETQSVEIYVDYYKKDGTKIASPVGPIVLSVNKNADVVKDKDYIVIDAPNEDPYSMTIRVSKVNNSTAGTSVLPQYISLEGAIELERYYNLDLVTVPFVTGSGIVNNCISGSCSRNENLMLSWDLITGAESYELEYTYVDDYSEVGLTSKADATKLSYDFRFNSTRVVTDKNFYEIPLTYDRGYLLYRVRAKGKALGVGLYDVYSKWSSENPNFGDKVASFADKISISGEAKMNYQASATFAEEGKRKDVISYFDGTLRSRQAVTKSNSTNFYIVGETHYDYEGRAIIQTLPVPVHQKSTLDYIPDFTKVKNGSSESTIKKSNYVLADGCTNPSPELSSTTIGAANYYSPLNIIPEEKLEKKNYIPDAEGYPYTQVQFGRDNTGRVRSQSGVGKDFRLGSTHETQYFYGKPEQEELDKLFGTNAGIAANYKKSIVIDGNGEASVSYLNQSGKVVATALVGDVTKSSALLPVDGGPGATEALDDVKVYALRNCPTSATNTSPQHCNSSNYRQDNSLVFSTELVVAVAQEYTFNYLLNTTNQAGCGSYCYNCVYDLDLSIKDECGLDVITPIITPVGNDGNENLGICDFSSVSFHGLENEKVTLPIGKYTIVKKLTVNEGKLNEYTDHFVLNCSKSSQDYFVEEMSKTDINSLCEELTCQTCLLSLSYDEDLSLENNFTVYKSNYPNTTMTIDDYKKSVDECNELCEPVSNCYASYVMMLTDMSPGNQYAAYDEKSEHWSLSVFNKKSYLNGLKNWWWTNSKELFRSPILNGNAASYTYEDGTTAYVPLEVTITEQNEISYEPAILQNAPIETGIINSSGVFVQQDGGDVKAVKPVYLANVADFVNLAWLNGWEKYLVEYHPEYCYYESCKGYSEDKDVANSGKYSSDLFDDRISYIRNYKDAVLPNGPAPKLENNITPNPNYDKKFRFNLLDGSVNSQNNIEDLVNRDPYFTVSEHDALKEEIIDRLTNYQGSGKNIKKFIAIATFCAGKYYASDNDLSASDCRSFGEGTEAEQDAQWQMYVSSYLGEKQAIQQREADFHCLAANSKGGFNGCIGEKNYNPFRTFTKDYYKNSAISFFSMAVQPCGFYLYQLFSNKEKRYSNHSDSEEKVGICNQESSPALPEDLRKKADLSIYMQTGQCPMTRDFETFLNDIAKKDILIKTTPTSLLRTGLTRDLYDWFRFGVNSVTGPKVNYIDYSISPTSSTDFVKDFSISKTVADGLNNATTIHFEVGDHQYYKYLDKADGKEYRIAMNFDLTPDYYIGNSITVTGGGKFIAKISGVRNLSFLTKDANGAYLFTADLTVDVYDQLKYIGTNYYVQVQGKTNIPLNANCDFSKVCEKTKAGEDLESLLNAVAGGGDLDAQNKAMAPALNPNRKPTDAPELSYEALLTPSITQYFRPEGGPYILNSVIAANALTLQINGNAGNEVTVEFQADPGFNASEVVAFTCFKVNESADNEFSLTAIQRNASNEVSYISLTGKVITYADQVTGSPMFKFQKCGPPTPDMCKTQAHENTEHLLNFLDEVVGDHKNSNGNSNYVFSDNFMFTMNGNQVFNSELKTQLGNYRNYYAKVTRTSYTGINLSICSNDNNNNGCIEGSIIDIPLSFIDDPGSDIGFEEIIGFAGLQPDYSKNVKMGHAYDFTVYAICKTPVNTSAFPVNIKMKGTSPFPLAECKLSCNAGKENLVINGDFSDPTLLPDPCGGCMCDVPDKSWEPFSQTVPKMISPTFGSDYCLLKKWNNKGWGAIVFARKPQDSGLEWDGYDHTDGKGFFLYADNKFQENDPLKKRAWYQEVYVEPGTYEFTTYAMNLHQQDEPNDGHCTGCKIRTWSFDSKEAIGTADNNYREERCDLATTSGFETNGTYGPGFGTFMLEDKIFLKMNISKAPYLTTDCPSPDNNKECARGLLTYTSPEGLTCKNGWVKISTIWENTNYTGKVVLDVSSIDPYYYGGDFGLDDISFSKICKPVITSTVLEPSVPTCYEMIQNLIEANADLKYKRNTTKAKEDFRKNYIDKCLTAAEEFTYAYKDYEYHHTLYYYDQAENLVKTIPPQGVDVIKDDNQLEAIFNDRLNKNLTPSLQPQHTLPTTYYYNSLNQLTAQSVPDHDKLNIFSGTPINGLAGFNVMGIQFKDALNGYLIAKETVPDPNELYPDRAHIFVTDDGGSSWTELTKLGILDLKDIQFVPGSDQIGHTVGTNGGLLRTENGGKDWLFKPVGTTNALTEVHFFDESHGLAFESDGSIWTTRDKGETWAETNPLSNPGSITDVHFNGINGFVLSNLNGKSKIFFTSNKGDTWTDFSTKFRIGGLNTLVTTDGNKVYAAGEAGILLKSTDSGENWSFVYSNADNKLFTKLYFEGPSNGCAILDNKVVYTNDGGVTWSPSNLPAGIIKDFQFENREGYCLSADKIIYRSKDAGKTWILTAPVFNLSAIVPEKVTAFYYDFDKILIGTENGRLYVNERFNSTQSNWKTLDLPRNKAVKKILFSTPGTSATILIADDLGTGSVYYTANVFATSVVWSSEKKINIEELKRLEGDIYGLARNGALYSSTDGNTWVDEKVISSDIKSIDKVSGEIIAVGGRKIYKSSTVANQKEFDPRNENVKIDPLRSIYCEDADHVYLTGKDGIFFKYNSNDKTFYQFPVPTNSDLNKVAVIGEKGVIAGTKGALFYSTNVSSESPQWTTSSLSATTDKDITDLSLTNPGVFASAGDGSVYTSSDFGATFTKRSTPANFSLDAISFSNAQKGIAAGKSGTIVMTTDGGTTWKDVTTIDPLKLTATFNVKNTQISYGVGKNSTIVKSTDLGKSWQPQKAGISTTKNFTSVAFKNEEKGENGIVVGNGIVLRTTNGGTSWEVLLSAPSFNYNSVSVFDNFVLAVGDGGNIAKSTDFGTTWTSVNTGTTNLNAVYALDSKNAFAVGNNGTILKMNAAGTWTPVALNSVAGIKLNNVYFTNLKTGYIVGANGTFAKTVDGGVTWVKKTDLNTTSDITNINFIDDNHAFLSGTNGFVSKVTDYSEEISSRFWYDELGRLVVSQNAKQFNNSEGKRYSYTKYDNLGRIVEVGELEPETDVETILLRNQVNSALLDNWITNTPESSKFEINRTYYNKSILSEETQNDLGFKPDLGNLRNRVASITYQRNGSPDKPDHASHFSYDLHGNVKELVQEIPYLDAFKQRYKKIRYDYDLISGKVNKVIYQENQPDQFIHKYEYDAENRITNVYTSEDGVNWAEDANYTYYAHGLLSRTEFGDLKVQGQDFAYTIQGWVKGVNATNISASIDPGNDGLTNSSRQNVGKDVYSYSLNYFDNDYKAINSNFLGNRTGSEFGTATNGHNLYNGNIVSMATTIMGQNDAPEAQGTAYTYDKLNRIKRMQAYANFDLTNNAWLSSGATSSYSSAYTYDNNGNIINLQRKNRAGVLFDDLTYRYDVINSQQTPVLSDPRARLRSNRLYHVNDKDELKTLMPTDIDDQEAFVDDQEAINEANNYQYDEIGNLIKDKSEGIHKIKWNVSGKVDMVISNGTKSGNHLKFLYDAQGNRIAKITKKFAAGDLDEQGGIEDMDWLNNCPTCTYTWYQRDVSGNVMSIYRQAPEAGNFELKLEEIPIYGSSRIGEYKSSKLLASRSTDLTLPYNPTSPMNLGYRGYTYNLNKKYYELNNHLGNVLSVVSDYRTLTGAQYSSIVLSSQDYYPFGSTMEDRGKAGTGYRYGFNGKEKDNDIKGSGNSYDFGARVYDPRLAKWYSCDFTRKSALSPYVFAKNNPVNYLDPDGNDEIHFYYKLQDNFDSEGHIYKSIEIYTKIIENGDKNHTFFVHDATIKDSRGVQITPFRGGTNLPNPSSYNACEVGLPLASIETYFGFLKFKTTDYELLGKLLKIDRTALDYYKNDKQWNFALNGAEKFTKSVEFGKTVIVGEEITYTVIDGYYLAKGIISFTLGARNGLWLGGASYGADPATIKSWNNLKPKKGWFDVVVHGDFKLEGYAFNIDNQPITAKELYERMLLSGYEPGTKIRLISCNAAKGPIAQELSNLAGAQVIAPSNLTKVLPGSKIVTIDGSKYKVFMPGNEAW